MIKATSINEVIAHLDTIIDWSKQHQSRIGYFATLYRRMTVAVQQGIANKSFEDAERMERLDVNFANRYLQAWDAYVNKKPCSSAWCAAFDACSNNSHIVLQHLLLGINTHINLDLGIAAAETCPGDTIYSLQKDFEKINTVIASLTEAVQDTLCKVWFPLRAVLLLADKRQEPVLNFSFTSARKASWANALALSVASGTAKDNYINMMDRTVAEIANRISHPGLALRFLLQPVLEMEDKNIGSTIELLKS